MEEYPEKIWTDIIIKYMSGSIIQLRGVNRQFYELIQDFVFVHLTSVQTIAGWICLREKAVASRPEGKGLNPPKWFRIGHIMFDELLEYPYIFYYLFLNQNNTHHFADLSCKITLLISGAFDGIINTSRETSIDRVLEKHRNTIHTVTNQETLSTYKGIYDIKKQWHKTKHDLTVDFLIKRDTKHANDLIMTLKRAEREAVKEKLSSIQELYIHSNVPSNKHPSSDEKHEIFMSTSYVSHYVSRFIKECTPMVKFIEIPFPPDIHFATNAPNTLTYIYLPTLIEDEFSTKPFPLMDLMELVRAFPNPMIEIYQPSMLMYNHMTTTLGINNRTHSTITQSPNLADLPVISWHFKSQGNSGISVGYSLSKAMFSKTSRETLSDDNGRGFTVVSVLSMLLRVDWDISNSDYKYSIVEAMYKHLLKIPKDELPFYIQRGDIFDISCMTSPIHENYVNLLLDQITTYRVDEVLREVKCPFPTVLNLSFPEKIVYGLITDTFAVMDIPAINRIISRECYFYESSDGNGFIYNKTYVNTCNNIQKRPLYEKIRASEIVDLLNVYQYDLASDKILSRLFQVTNLTLGHGLSVLHNVLISIIRHISLFYINSQPGRECTEFLLRV